jgi:hypothetical protein
VALFNLQFTQRPPDDLIEIMGRILDANVASAKRREERIIITPDSSRKLNIFSKESAIFIQKVPRHCILRDVSFSGAKIIMMGVAKFLVDKEAALRMDFDDPRESFLLKGKLIRSEPVEGRKELVALGIIFDENSVPMGYKIRLNDYLSQVRAEDRGSEKTSGGAAKKSVPVKAPERTPAEKAPAEKAPAEKPPAEKAENPAPEKSTPAKPATPASPPPAAAPKTTGDDDFDLNIPS